MQFTQLKKSLFGILGYFVFLTTPLLVLANTNNFVGFLPGAVGPQVDEMPCIPRLAGIDPVVQPTRGHEVQTDLHKKITALHDYLNSIVIGQQNLTRAGLVALLVGGHLLVEGTHGTGKTLLGSTLASAVSANSKKLQFTPDLMPGDITGSSIYDHELKKYIFHPGPLFTNIMLAEELNRAPERTQSALLEAMGNGEVTVSGITYKTDKIFMIIATQNPHSQLGTYQLPEAQRDRFLFGVKSAMTGKEYERKILKSKLEKDLISSNFQPIKPEDLLAAREAILKVGLPAETQEYILTLIDVSRNAERHPTLTNKITEGISNRGTMGLVLGAKAMAWLRGSTSVLKSDVDAILHDTFRHRLLLTDSAKSDAIDTDMVIDAIKKIANDQR